MGMDRAGWKCRGWLCYCRGRGDPDGDVQYSQTSLSSYNNRVTWNDTCLFHPALANRDIRLRRIQRVKEELNGPEHTGDVRTLSDSCIYNSQKSQALPPAESYLQSSIIRDGRTVIFGIHPELIRNIHRVRSLDCDTTFKPVAGSMQIFEVNAWLTAINEVQYRASDPASCQLRERSSKAGAGAAIEYEEKEKEKELRDMRGRGRLRSKVKSHSTMARISFSTIKRSGDESLVVIAVKSTRGGSVTAMELQYHLTSDEGLAPKKKKEWNRIERYIHAKTR
ncbi:hypothetical protein B0H13DRAFT_1884636 [Mycena leptocephala]|nr:hypothetical protein B0H13DRAFT_1884636 [Mycena leptocephala]